KRIRFEVQSSKDTVKSKKEIEKLKNKKDTLKKKIFHLEYNLANKELKEIPDTLKEKKQLAWANFSPDTTKVFFAKNYNLYWMDKENYEKAVQDEKDSTIVEHQITTDGEQYYAWGGDEYSTTTGDDKKEKENREKRKAVHFSWSPDGKHFVLTRKDNRHLNPLWVINNVGKKRPTLETYKYLIPGEKDSTEVELHIFDANTLESKEINISSFKNQTLSIFRQKRDKSSYTGKYLINYWLGDDEQFYMARSSRDLKRIDLLAVSVNGDVNTLVEERSNLY